MMKFNFVLAFLLLIPVSNAIADAVIFQTDFQSLPDNWFANDQWSFTTSGAVITRTDRMWDDVLFTQSNSRSDCIYFVPDGTDSVLVEIPYSVYVNNSETSGGASFNISASIEPYTFARLLELSVWQAGVYQYAGTIEHVFHREGSGWLGFFIEFTGGCEVGCAISAQWTIQGITVTAYGDDLSLNPLTWASIKASF